MFMKLRREKLSSFLAKKNNNEYNTKNFDTISVVFYAHFKMNSLFSTTQWNIF